MTRFIFDSYHYNETSGEATFRYKSDAPDLEYVERITLQPNGEFDRTTFDRALFLAFILIGTPYYKAFPSRDVAIKKGSIDQWQADFFSKVYQEGLSQFAFENHKKREDLAHFLPTGTSEYEAGSYHGNGIVALQSGGKDSLLVAELFDRSGHDFSALYITNGPTHPSVIDETTDEVGVVHRQIDKDSLKNAAEQGGLNGHVPVTYITLAIGLLQTILDSKATLVAAIGHEGEEPHEWIEDLPVNHQWSKTWPAEKLFAEYVQRFISPDIHVGSVLRKYSELRIAELFAANCWSRFGASFSSCNLANYAQGADNSELKWCGNCPKCANSYLLFAPFVSAVDLQALFGGRDLFQESRLIETFKGLLGVDGVMKPFECVGEIAELRAAYHTALHKEGFDSLPFDVPKSSFDYRVTYPEQQFAQDLLG